MTTLYIQQDEKFQKEGVDVFASKTEAADAARRYGFNESDVAEFVRVLDEIEVAHLIVGGYYTSAAAAVAAAAGYDVEIAEYNSADIRYEGAQVGATHMRLIGEGYHLGRQEADAKVRFFAIPGPHGEFRVADTNGDPVWENNDPQGFAELAESCGVEI